MRWDLWRWVLAGMLGWIGGAFAQERSVDAETWRIPSVEETLSFPKDHGSHPDFRIEWWYLTGHLFAESRRFGFQATFFRIGQKPIADREGEAFGTHQIYMAHMGLSDPETGQFIHEERMNRGGWDAGAKVGGLDVHNGNWRLKAGASGIRLEGSIQSEVELSLSLLAHKDLVIFGEEGISRKGPEGTASSYYITYPRLEAEGELRVAGETLQVAGEAWMDHEISSSQLDRNQIGWDWVSIQFDDGREIMGYVIRNEEGEVSDYSRLVWIDLLGELTHQTLDEYRWIHDGEWESPKTGAVYPITPIVETIDPSDGKKKRFQLSPTMPNQEMVGGAGGVSYWEGACDVIDLESGEAVGKAFLEMTGYADDVGEKLR